MKPSKESERDRREIRVRCALCGTPVSDEEERESPHRCVTEQRPKRRVVDVKVDKLNTPR